MIMPIPPIKPNPKSIPVLIEVGKKIWDWVKSKFNKTADEVGQENPLTNESTIEDVSKINEIFNEFKLSVEKEAKPLIEKIKSEIEDYADELCFIVEQQNEVLVKANINLRSFRRQINKLKKNIDGKIENEISRVISLDNPECKTIVKMLPGEKKKKALKSLLIKAVDNGIEVVNEKVSDTIAEINDDFEILIGEAIEEKEKEANSQLLQLNDAKLMVENQTEMKAIMSSNAYLMIDNCEVVVKRLNGVD